MALIILWLFLVCPPAGFIVLWLLLADDDKQTRRFIEGLPTDVRQKLYPAYKAPSAHWKLIALIGFVVFAILRCTGIIGEAFNPLTLLP
jgi:hypothetical protein